MAKNFPVDEFDGIHSAPGRRRARRSNAARLLEFVSYFSISAIVAGGALFGYQTLLSGGTNIDLNAFSDSGTKVSNDPLRVNETTIFDGAGKTGLAGSVAQKLVDKGWNVVTAANIEGDVAVAKTVIYINSAQLNDAAKALVSDLGNYTIEVSNNYIDPITVVLGSDYQ